MYFESLQIQFNAQIFEYLNQRFTGKRHLCVLSIHFAPIFQFDCCLFDVTFLEKICVCSSVCKQVTK